MVRRLTALALGALTVLAGPAFAEPVRPFEPVWAGPLMRSPRVAHPASPGRTVLHPSSRSLVTLPTDPMAADQWYLYNGGSPGADASFLAALHVWAPQRAAVVAVIDSGLDLTHEDIDPSCLWTNPGESGLDDQGRDRSTNGVDDDGNGYADDVHGWNFVTNTPEVQERNYHGTHVTGLLSAVRNNGVGVAGVAPGVSIMPVKIFDIQGTADSARIGQALRYAADNGARVLSCSWGSPSSSTAILDALGYCDEKGVLVCCAAGNSRKHLEDEPDYPAAYGLPNQVIVGASDETDDDALFANWGRFVDLAAPGNHILSLMPKGQYRAFSGTSQAAPQVAAAAAMLWAQEPGLTHVQVKERLVASADRRTGLARWVRSAGRLNVHKLLTGTPGDPLPPEPAGPWQSQPWTLESRHPYPYDADETHVVEVPGARWLRVRFSRFTFDTSSDYLEVRDAAGRVVERLNADLGAVATRALAGPRITLRMVTNDKVNAWGFAVEAVETISE